jgi:hypothetical protein
MVSQLLRRVYILAPPEDEMLHNHSEITKPPLTEPDIKMVYEALAAWCHERRHAIGTQEANEAARELVSWFECGIRDRHKLMQILRYI